MMGKSTDCQKVYGVGVCGRTSNGTLNNKGMFWGSNTKGSNVKVFGMESRWGVMNRHLEGVYVATDGIIRFKFTEGTHDGSTSIGYSNRGGYIKMSGLALISSPDYYSWDQVMSVSNCTFGRWPNASLKGSATTYECDRLGSIIKDPSNSVPYILTHGGCDESYSAYNGPFSITGGKRLDIKTGDHSTGFSYKPLAT